MKKLIYLFLSLIFVLSTFAFGCGEDCEDGVHSFGPWQVAKEPTCAEVGIEERVCTNDYCSAKEQRDLLCQKVIVAVDEVPATCYAFGTAEHFECSVCHVCFADLAGTTIVNKSDLTLRKRGHSYNHAEWVVEVEPGEYTTGSRYRRCDFYEHCGYVQHQTIPSLTEDPNWTPNI